MERRKRFLGFGKYRVVEVFGPQGMVVTSLLAVLLHFVELCGCIAYTIGCFQNWGAPLIYPKSITSLLWQFPQMRLVGHYGVYDRYPKGPST